MDFHYLESDISVNLIYLVHTLLFSRLSTYEIEDTNQYKLQTKLLSQLHADYIPSLIMIYLLY